VVACDEIASRPTAWDCLIGYSAPAWPETSTLLASLKAPPLAGAPGSRLARLKKLVEVVLVRRGSTGYAGTEIAQAPAEADEAPARGAALHTTGIFGLPASPVDATDDELVGRVDQLPAPDLVARYRMTGITSPLTTLRASRA
jgi:hypothetical protein